MIYASFNLQNINAPVPPKWKHNDHILEEYKKFHHSCQCIFDGPMAHVMNGKVKINMFGVDLMEKIYIVISIWMTMRNMT